MSYPVSRRETYTHVTRWALQRLTDGTKYAAGGTICGRKKDTLVLDDSDDWLRYDDVRRGTLGPILCDVCRVAFDEAIAVRDYGGGCA